MSEKVLVIIPVFNDWVSVQTLLKSFASDIDVLIVNDGSYQEYIESLKDVSLEIHILHLVRNLGHQRAIASGLCYAYEHFEYKYFAIMDGDGEDTPESLNHLIKEIKSNPSNQIVFGSRARRSESMFFRFGYKFYKILFRLLAGNKIEFGHFCAFKFKALKSIISVSQIWNHFPAGVIHSKIPYKLLPFDRGVRIDGQSKMNSISLVMHGLSAISVFNEFIGIKMLSLLFRMIVIVVISLSFVISIRLFTDFAIPGWSSTVGLALVIILIQLMSISLSFVFQLLGSRSQNEFVPIRDYHVFIDRCEKIND